MSEKILEIHLDSKYTDQSAVTSEAVVQDGSAKLYVNVSWNSALADEISMEINETSISDIILSDRPDTFALLNVRRSGIMFDTIEAALGSKYGKVFSQLLEMLSGELKKLHVFADPEQVPFWYRTAAI